MWPYKGNTYCWEVQRDKIQRYILTNRWGKRNKDLKLASYSDALAYLTPIYKGFSLCQLWVRLLVFKIKWSVNSPIKATYQVFAYHKARASPPLVGYPPLQDAMELLLKIKLDYKGNQVHNKDGIVKTLKYWKYIYLCASLLMH